MPWPVHPTGFFGARGDQDSYRIERSLRFNSADSAYLNRTPASAGNRKTWTFSAWIKLGNTNPTIATPLGTILSGSNGGPSLINSSGLRFCHAYDPTGTDNVRMTSAIVRDPSAWYHVVWWCDTTQAGTRWKIYINGVEQTLETPAGYNGEPAQNTDLSINAASQHLIGQYAGSYFDGYLTEINFIDGQALTPSSFGETDAITGRWKAKAYSGTYGTNGFYLKFADNSGTTATTLGKDSSGNGNNWTPNNFSVSAYAANDSLVDSPTNYGSDTGVGGEVRGNYATLNPISTIRGTIIDGNLRTNGGDRGSIATIGMSSGKWFCEMYVTTLGAESSVGISRGLNVMNTYVGAASDSWGYYYNGLKYNNATSGTYGSSYTAGDTVGVAFDADAGTLIFTKNGVSQGTAYSSLTSGPYYFAVSGRSSTSANDVTMNFGQQAWKYAPPSGYKALCTTNLSIPTIQKPSKYMDVLTYTGNGTYPRTISGLGFQPDLVWIKARPTTYSHILYDSVRGTGTGANLSSNETSAEGANSIYTNLTAFTSDGFTIGSTTSVNVLNNNTTTFVAWAWDEAPIAGMDIVSYTGTGTAGTVAHNLGVAPRMMIVKSRSRAGDNWDVYHASVGATGRLYLNLTNATDTSIAPWNNTAPTSSVFTVGTAGDTNANGVTYIAYLFAEVEGFSKFGSYTGNGSADGPFVWCGFRPRWVMMKRIDAAGKPWCIHDTARDIQNVSNSELEANSATAENGGTYPGDLDILSNGFKPREGSSAWINESGTFIFAAFAESPFKYARAR